MIDTSPLRLYPVYYSGSPFDFAVDMQNEIPAAAIVSVLVHTWQYGPHLHGVSDDPHSDISVSVDPTDTRSVKVSVSGQKCRILPEGFVRTRVVVRDVEGKTTEVRESVVAEIGKYYQPNND